MSKQPTPEPDRPDLTADGEPVGWRVLDPDGNVVDSGPGIAMIAVAESGPDTPEEN